MKFSVGYQMCESSEFLESIIANKEQIYEVYFSWGDFANGRNCTTQMMNLLPWEAQNSQIADLEELSSNGIKLNMLFNATCYGEESLSEWFFNKIGYTVDYIKNKFGLQSITTTSPIIAKFMKANFKALDIRASVNMCIGTEQGLDYVSELFDSFYMKRECNRNLKQIIAMKKWCDERGKKLFMLANSGCLNHCSAHTFHDNLVSHEVGLSKMDSAYSFTGICHDYLYDSKHWVSLIRDMSFVRPEDIDKYEGMFEAVKLATRKNSNPVRILKAYIGSIPELLEPNHTMQLLPYLLDNTLFPKDFAGTVLNCDKNCASCKYCESVLNRTLIELEK